MQTDEMSRVAELADLDEWGYQRARKAAAEELGIDVEFLDKKVEAVRPRNLGNGQAEDWSPPPEPDWPQPLGEAAYHGVVGDFVKLVTPQTESDPAALLFQFLAAAGNCFGHRTWFAVEETRHYPNLFVLIAGDTSKARKGTSLRWVLRVLQEAAPEWSSECIVGGLSTGEGLIERVRDSVSAPDKTGAMQLVDAGAKDKRLLVREEEFSRPIRVLSRNENTLAAVLRQAWDGVRLAVLTRNKPIKASEAAVSIIGQITISELVSELNEIEVVNGFANRFLFAVVKRSKLLPFGGDVGDGALSEIANRVRAAIVAAPAVRVRFDEAARRRWIDEYSILAAPHPGMFGAVTARSEAQVVRVALIYALLDQQDLIGLAHLEAALEVVRYSNDSVRHIFGDLTGSRIADTIIRALRAAGGGGMTRSQISRELFGRNVLADDIASALASLSTAGRIRREVIPSTGGRPAEVWKWDPV